MNEDAERIRHVLIEAALRAHEDAGFQGLCAEGRWEAAVDAMRSVDLEPPTGPGQEPEATPPEVR